MLGAVAIPTPPPIPPKLPPTPFPQVPIHHYSHISRFLENTLVSSDTMHGMEPEPVDLSSQLYEDRLLVFLEDQEVKGFRQVYLTPKQFQKISNAIICETASRDKVTTNKSFGEELVPINLEEHRIIPEELFEGMNSINL